MKCIIRTVPERKDYLNHLIEVLGDPVIICDDDKKGAMYSFICALNEANDQPVLMFEDDAILVKDFKVKASRVIIKRSTSL